MLAVVGAIAIGLWLLANAKLISSLFTIALWGSNHKGSHATMEWKVQRRAVIVVGGDFARSPRMQYHAVSLMNSGLYDVISLVGVDDGNKLCEALQPQQTPAGVRIDKTGLLSLVGRGGACAAVLSFVDKRCPVKPLRWVLLTLLRLSMFITFFGLALYRVLTVSVVVARATRTSNAVAATLTVTTVVFCQTPPAVPFVVLVKVICAFVRLSVLVPLRVALVPLLRLAAVGKGQRTILSHIATAAKVPRVIVDWHNFGFTLLQVDNRPALIVAVYKFFERYCCCGDVNVTVSKAMQRALTSNEGNNRIGPFRLGTPVHVLYDTAPAFFSHVTRQFAVQQLCLSDPVRRAISNVPSWFVNPDSNNTGFVIVSSTSWGSDDDYHMVVQALKLLDAHLSTSKSSSLLIKNVWLVVTGKGPTRERFEKAVTEAKLSAAVAVSTVYFQSFLDYSTMLGAGDLGLSVHFSSSGLDLPMKCVDMLGAGLPVAAVAYDCIEELVTTESGWLFHNVETLFQLLVSFLEAPGQQSLRQKARYVAQHRELWDDSWNRVIKPLLPK